MWGEICVNSKVTFMEIVMDFLRVYFMALSVTWTRAKFGLGTSLKRRWKP
jgi:hypothetical protein